MIILLCIFIASQMRKYAKLENKNILIP